MKLECIDCGSKWPTTEIRYRCDCAGLLQVVHADEAWSKVNPDIFDQRLQTREGADRSGVWRFREVVYGCAESQIVSHPEGSTRIYRRPKLSEYAGVKSLGFKHEGDNPSGSFKDRGMTVAVTAAKALGAISAACASTGNTSSSLASYAAHAGMKAVVFLPAGKVALGKLSQTVGYGARCLAIEGDFDAAMDLVQDAAKELGIYLVNSINPFRLEGQKTIIFELLQDLNWQPPDWIVFPAGNLGNTSAFGKALREAHAAGWISKVPKLAAVQAKGANPFFTSFQENFAGLKPVQAETVATAIRIGNPVSFKRAKRAIEETKGVVCEVSDEKIMAAKRLIDGTGIGCEPASACSLAGTKLLREQGTIGEHETVIGILTGHMLKDPPILMEETAGQKPIGEIIEIEASVEAVRQAVAREK